GRVPVRAAVPVIAPPDIAPPLGPGGDVIEPPGGPLVQPMRVRKPKSRSKRARRRNLIIGAFAAFIMLVGTSAAGRTSYFDSSLAPSDFAQPESTTIYYSDGKTPMAKIGEENRTLIPFSEMPEAVRNAVVAAEDHTFYINKGVDYKGIIRAAW